jgi:tetratricopeptide (TPR) repeat protein
VLLRQAKYESSVEELGAAVQIDPDSPKYVTLLAESLIGWRHFGVAVDYLHAAETRIGPAYHYDLGLAYYNLNQRKDAEAEFREATRIDPDLDRAQFMLAASYADDHELTKAVEIYRGLVKKRP